ncbi:MAG: hypothetical protein ACTSRS_18970 [Candidatus Helarchaeota archaeon]
MTMLDFDALELEVEEVITSYLKKIEALDDIEKLKIHFSVKPRLVLDLEIERVDKGE